MSEHSPRHCRDQAWEKLVSQWPPESERVESVRREHPELGDDLDAFADAHETFVVGVEQLRDSGVMGELLAQFERNLPQARGHHWFSWIVPASVLAACLSLAVFVIAPGTLRAAADWGVLRAFEHTLRSVEPIPVPDAETPPEDVELIELRVRECQAIALAAFDLGQHLLASEELSEQERAALVNVTERVEELAVRALGEDRLPDPGEPVDVVGMTLIGRLAIELQGLSTMSLPEELRLAPVFRAALMPAQVELRVIHLGEGADAVGVEVTSGYRVFSEAWQLRQAIFADPQYHPDAIELKAGDHRLTVVLDSGEFAQRRIEARSGEQMNLTVFVRARPLGLEDMATVPAADIEFGDPDPRTRNLPPRPVFVPPFQMDRREVSSAAYARFYELCVQHSQRWFGHPEPPLQQMKYHGDNGLPISEDLPMSMVSWHDAVLYANWAGKRLPTEREWESAAEGAETRKYPWGDEFVEGAVHSFGGFSGEETHSSSDARMFAFVHNITQLDDESVGATPQGIQRLGDGVSEWVAEPFTLDRGDTAIRLVAERVYRTVRGGCWEYMNAWFAQSNKRSEGLWSGGLAAGFRCVATSPPPWLGEE